MAIVGEGGAVRCSQVVLASTSTLLHRSPPQLSNYKFMPQNVFKLYHPIVSCLFNGKIRFKGFVRKVISFLKFYFRR